MSKLDEIQVKVQKFLSEALGNINVGSDGAIEFPFGSTKVSIKVKELMGATDYWKIDKKIKQKLTIE